MCKCADGRSSTTVFGHTSESFPLAPKFYYPPLSVMLAFLTLSTLKQKSRNRQDVENGMRLVLTNTPP